MLNRIVAACVLGLLTTLLALLQVNGDAWMLPGDGSWTYLVGTGVALATGLAVALAGRWPGVSLAMLWLVLGVQVVNDTHLLLAQIGAAFVAFACAAWGRKVTLWLSGVSIPLAVLAVTVTLDPWQMADRLALGTLRDLARSAYDSSLGWRAVLGAIAVLALAAPWLLGLAVRFSRRSVASEQSQRLAEADRAQAVVARAEAEEVARLREDQAQLARDVHDVVGHSLTVILAQAEAGQFTRDPEALHRTLGTIVDSARASLTDVRQVLHATGGHPVVAGEGDLAVLLDGVRASGREVVLVDLGQARPLPPDRATPVHRVVQEMLTNAVRHGHRSAPIRVEREWGNRLRITVSNSLAGPVGRVAPAPHPVATGNTDSDLTQPVAVAVPAAPGTGAEPARVVSGRGIDGMRRRLEAVGGRLQVTRNDTMYAASAWVPLEGHWDEPWDGATEEDHR